jgi:outer membrane cobalamin receptor
VDNALDEEYLDMKGYSTPGREYYAGLRAIF